MEVEPVIADAAMKDSLVRSGEEAVGDMGNSGSNASARTPAIALLTSYSVPHQNDLFDAVELLRPGALVVYYLHRQDTTRSWPVIAPRHSARFLDVDAAAIADARQDFRAAQLAVFNFYTEPPVSELLKIRVASGGAWCFWGERPGYRHPLLSRLLRLWKLRALHASRRPIWGIGRWAVDAYQREFGSDRSYANIPYFSDLARFQCGAILPFSQDLTFLYSGSLSSRKGVDLLARTFCRIAKEEPRARLKILGQGGLEDVMRAALVSCQDRVEWIRFKDWKEFPAVYSSAHILCVPSRHDGWGLVVAEGLATGLPVISTDRTGAAIDLVKPGCNGWLVRAGNEDSLYEAMHTALKLGERQWQDMSRQARESVKRHTPVDGANRFLAAADSALREAVAP